MCTPDMDRSKLGGRCRLFPSLHCPDVRDYGGLPPLFFGRIGNTAGASVLLALADLLSTRRPAVGARILLGAFGAGLTWCAAVLEWGVVAECAEDPKSAVRITS